VVNVRRGDIVYVDLGPTEGSEQAGKRPSLVLQNDAGNRAASTTIIAPLTTSYDPQNVAPYEAELTAANTDVQQDSVVLLNQIRVVSVPDRVITKFGHVPHGTPEMAGVNRAILVSLDL
jgi:mRNA interferase MazF